MIVTDVVPFVFFLAWFVASNLGPFDKPEGHGETPAELEFSKQVPRNVLRDPPRLEGKESDPLSLLRSIADIQIPV
jgi:hypothetical protein